VAEKTTKAKQKSFDARLDVFEEFFNDYFKRRKQVYYLNFIRGIWFGLGTVLGGTLLITLLLWVLTWFQQIPFLSDIVENVQRSIESGRH
jgi:hypothetical protein